VEIQIISFVANGFRMGRWNLEGEGESSYLCLAEIGFEPSCWEDALL
jgi:hypothetical protein